MTHRNSRRQFLAAAASAATAAAAQQQIHAETRDRSPVPIPMVHATDLYRPHNDPDDHWDLACVYALIHKGAFDLKGVLIDFPPPDRPWDPDVMAVAQMNYLTGSAVPVLIGSPRSSVPAEAATMQSDLAGVRGLLDILRRSPRPVAINIVGSTRDVALASKLEPRLFASKCAAVYLNAGSGSPDRAKAAKLEYNVSLDPASYAAIFQLPCPVYWMPCFEYAAGDFSVGEWGTLYKFRHDDVLPALSGHLQNYFALMYRHGEAAGGSQTKTGSKWDWLHSLNGPKDTAMLAKQAPLFRSMWCTGGFLHAAGLTVSRDGRILPRTVNADPVFTFDPVRVTCSPGGVTEWTPDPSATNRYIYHVRDLKSYERAMTSALKSLLMTLP